MSDYYCKACEAPATVDEQGVHRTCECNTTVIAGMSAHARGMGAVRESGLADQFLALVKASAHKYLHGRL